PAAAAETTAADAAHELPSIDLPAADDIDAFIARFERGEALDATPESEAAAPPAEPQHDLRYAVDIAPGVGLEDLVIGEAATPEPAAHDLHGLALTETEPVA